MTSSLENQHTSWKSDINSDITLNVNRQMEMGQLPVIHSDKCEEESHVLKVAAL